MAWKLFNTMAADFGVTALEAIAPFGEPEIFNTDQGYQCLHNSLRDADIRISMDGRGRWIDNVIIERLVALDEIRMRLPQCLRDRQRGKKRDRMLDRLLQPRSIPLGLRRQDQRGLC
jgi:hypothetical protein